MRDLGLTQPNLGGAPIGNQNARKGREWRQAIDRALEIRGNGDRSKALDALAEKLLKKVDEGDIAAIKEFGDRIDGKAPQSVIVGNEDGQTFTVTWKNGNG